MGCIEVGYILLLTLNVSFKRIFPTVVTVMLVTICDAISTVSAISLIGKGFIVWSIVVYPYSVLNFDVDSYLLNTV